MADSAPTRDDGLDRLEAFSALLASTGEALASQQALLDGEVDGLGSEAGAIGEGLAALGETLATALETLSSLQQATSAELAALAEAASALAEHRLADARGDVERLEGAFAAGLGDLRTTADDEATESQEQLAQAGQELDDRAAQLSAVEQADGAAVGQLQAWSARAAGLVTQTGNDLQAALEETAALAVGWAQFAGGGLDAFREHLESEAGPLLMETLRQLAADLARSFEDLQAAVEGIGEEVVADTESLLADAVSFTEQLTQAHEKQAGSSEDDALVPLADETGRNGTAMTEGAHGVSELAALAPSVGAARNVAHEVEEMMSMLNPFD